MGMTRVFHECCCPSSPESSPLMLYLFRTSCSGHRRYISNAFFCRFDSVSVRSLVTNSKGLLFLDITLGPQVGITYRYPTLLHVRNSEMAIVCMEGISLAEVFLRPELPLANQSKIPSANIASSILG